MIYINMEESDEPRFYFKEFVIITEVVVVVNQEYS